MPLAPSPLPPPAPCNGFSGITPGRAPQQLVPAPLGDFFWRPAMGTKLYVGNLTYGVTDSDLEQMFAPHGTVHCAPVTRDRPPGRSKGFGFVEMGSDQEA